MTTFKTTVHEPSLGLAISHGAVYKPRRQLRGQGELLKCLIHTLFNKCYIEKVSTKGEGGQTPNFVYLVLHAPCGHGKEEEG